MLLHLHEPIVTYLLPVLHSKVNCAVEGDYEQQLLSEQRYLCLKLLTDMLLVLLNEDQIYSASGKNEGAAQQKLDSLITNSLVPLAAQLIQEPEPGPFFG